MRLKDHGTAQTGGSDNGWEDAYVVLQGHRLVWWRDELEVENGKVTQLLFTV